MHNCPPISQEHAFPKLMQKKTWGLFKKCSNPFLKNNILVNKIFLSEFLLQIIHILFESVNWQSFPFAKCIPEKLNQTYYFFHFCISRKVFTKIVIITNIASFVTTNWLDSKHPVDSKFIMITIFNAEIKYNVTTVKCLNEISIFK